MIDVALHESVFNMMESLLPEYSVFGQIRQPAGSSLPGIAPSNAYRCQDGKYVLIAGNGDSIFKRLMEVIGRPDLAASPELADNAGRVGHVAMLDDAISQWTGRHPLDAVLQRLNDGRIPAGKIYDVADIAADPHYQARGMILDGALPDGTPVKLPGILPKLSETPGEVRARPRWARIPTRCWPAWASTRRSARTARAHHLRKTTMNGTHASRPRLYLQEVAPRDGFQNETRFIDTADKIAVIDQLSACGYAKIEVTSFTSPKAIPALRDAEIVMQAIARNPDVTYTALVPNARGARALECGLDEINLVMSVSETHNRANLRMTREQSFAQLRDVVEAVRGSRIAINVSLSTVFGCPMEGDIDANAVYALVERFAALGVDGVTLCDTTGMAYPTQVGRIGRACAAGSPA